MLTITLLSVLGLVLLFVGFAKNISLSITLASLGLVACLVSLFWCDQNLLTASGIETQLSFDSVATKFSGLILGFSVFIVLLAGSFIRKEYVQSAEFLAVMVFSLVGAVMLTAFTHMVTLFVGLETLSISLYILAGTDKKSPESNEASLKYLLLGAFATGLILFGMAMLYGATGVLDFSQMATLGAANVDSSLFIFGIFFLLIGVLFKISAAPFHFWSPDVYEGSPNVVMLYMSVVVKIASFAAIYRIFNVYMGNLSFFWWDLMYYACVASLILGNLLALVQTSLKRQLAFSSISQTGYLLFALLVLKGDAILDSLVFYLFVYGTALLVSFSVLMGWFGTSPDIYLDKLKGAGQKDKAGSLVLTFAFLSMAGIPLTGGFFAKLYLFTHAMQGGLYSLLIIAILSSVVGAAYYFRPIINLWFSKEDAQIETQNGLQWVGFLGGAIILITGFFPDALSALIGMM